MITAGVAVLLALPAGLGAQQMSGTMHAAPPQVVVTGEGEVKVTPDRATVYIGVQTRGRTAAAAAAENSQRQRAIIDTLRALGIAQAQIRTVNYSVHPEVVHDPRGQDAPRVTGYVVGNSVRVEVQRIDQVSSVIDAGLAKGANNIAGIEFSVSTAEEARRQALEAAVRRARADAEAMAAAAGGQLGPLLELVSNAPMYRPMYAARDMVEMRATAAPAPTPVEPGEQTIQANVSVRWTFIPRN
jgi:uncharacterized protein